VKNSLHGDVSEKPMMRMIYPFSVGTLTCVKLIVMMCECTCATVSEQFTVAYCFFSFGEDDYDELHHLIHKFNKVILKRSKFHCLDHGKPSRPP
jgi:hypothetical protein